MLLAMVAVLVIIAERGRQKDETFLEVKDSSGCTETGSFSCGSSRAGRATGSVI